MPPHALRLFIATPLDDSPAEVLAPAMAQLQTLSHLEDWGKLSWVPPENRHITWHFIGETDPSRQSEIQERLEQALAVKRALALTLDSLEIWPDVKRPRLLVWRGREARAEDPVGKMAAAIQSCFPESLLEHRSFIPHVTLARFRREKGGSPKLSLSGIPALFSPWTVSNIQLVHSTLTPQGAVYQTLSAWSLEGLATS